MTSTQFFQRPPGTLRANLRDKLTEDLTKPADVGIALAEQLRLELNCSQAFARRPVEDQMIATGNHLLPRNALRFAAVFSEALKLIRQRIQIPLVPRFTGAAGPVFAAQGLIRSRAGAES